MKKTLFLLLLNATCFVSAEDRFWIADSTGLVPADQGLLFTLESEALQWHMDQSLRASGVMRLSLPRPDGQVAVFNVSPYPVMAPELAAKYPQIQPFYGFNEDLPGQKIYLDVSQHGLHAMIRGAGENWWIDPLAVGDAVKHRSYYRHQLAREAPSDWTCGVDGETADSVHPPHTRGALPSNQGVLKTYRLAVAATGEYTTFHSTGPANVADGLAAVVTAMVRVNGIYENDLAIRMVLVADNDLVIYTNGATDPYTNNSGGAMLTQNQINLDAVIGDADYDIGHVFSTGGGGIANLNSPCNTGFKARGVTGLSSPTGDVFWVDYVSHEMGHQWGAPHTFNSVAGACNGNRTGAEAFEPGSGSTIMAYAGICGSDNLQSNSDDYFHTASLERIVNYSNGQGACFVGSNTDNIAPSVDAGFDHVIPLNTPFELCASGFDVDTSAAQLTYAWEQHDLGPAGSPNSPSGNAPLFRSFQPVNDPCRTFPQKSDLLNNTQTIGEILPSYGRDLNFRVTLRDNEVGGGAFNTDELDIQVDGNGGPFVLLAPNGGEFIAAGDPVSVQWNVGSTDQAPVNCASVDVWLSLDGGNSFNVLWTAATPNDGSEMLNMLNIDSAAVRVKVQCSGNVFFDISNSTLQVNGSDLIFANGFD